MHSRFPAGWRFTLWTAVLATLILLPCSTAKAGSVSSVLPDSTQTSLSAVDSQPDNGVSSRVSFARANYVWPYAAGPSYGEVERAIRRAPGILHTKVGSFPLGRGALNIPDELKATNRLAELGVQYFVIALDSGSSPPDVARLVEQGGGAVVQWIPVRSMIARITPAAMSALQDRTDVVAIEPYHPAFKLDPNIGRVPLPDPAKALSEVYELDVRLFKGEDAAAVAESLTKLGGNVVRILPDTIRIELHRGMLADLAALQPVKSITEALPYYTHSEEITTCVQTGRWNSGATPYHDAGVDGSGGGLPGTAPQVLMVLDSGIQLDNADLSDTSTNAGIVGTEHRKVVRYQTTNTWGGSGDLLGCDDPANGGSTHGHFVSSVALGNASTVDESYGDPWFVTDIFTGLPWRVDGLAPGAKLVAFDGMVTPFAISCQDPDFGNIYPGDLYTAPSAGSMHAAYTDNNARVFNFSFGTDSNNYDPTAEDVDDFLDDHRDAMVFVSAANLGLDIDPQDGFPDEGSLGSTANNKNGVVVGASFAPDDLAGPDDTQEDGRAFFSSVGPTGAGNRIGPLLMAPGADIQGSMGLATVFGCRSSDNTQTNPVECDMVNGIQGTSFSAPAAAGAALLVRDYFAQGFYPDGTSSNTENAADQVENISGALVKAVLIASADFMTSFNLSRDFRFNNEQGYGRIWLAKALPLESYVYSTTGLIVADGGISGGVSHLSGLDGTLNAAVAEYDEETFEVCDATQELRVALAWVEGSGDSLINDLNLELQAPSGKVYWGNYFTDDNNRSRAQDAGEDCPGIDGTLGELDEAAWSLPIGTCANAIRDTENPTEAIMLSPDYDGDDESDLNPADDDQLELGTWTVRVASAGTGVEAVQRYAVAISGGVCVGSAVRWSEGTYSCNSVATITVSEFAETGDPLPSESQVAGRTTVDVLDPDGLVVDTETGLTFTSPASLKYEAEITLTDGTAYDPGNGVLDIRSGDRVRVSYADVDSSGLPDANKVRRSIASVNCRPQIGVGDVQFFTYARDTTFIVNGGCERNPRGTFDWDYPDRYMDASEALTYTFGFSSSESIDLNNVEVGLRCVIPDSDSQMADGGFCTPHSDDCADPNRLNNAYCDGTGDPGDPVYMTILDSPVTIGFLPAGEFIAVAFSIQMEPTIPGTPEVEMMLEVTSRTAGKTAVGLGINQHTLDVDENNIFYSTDFPTGGTDVFDWNNNEIAEDPITNYGDFWGTDFRFETMTYSDLTAGGTKNTYLQSPWTFDANDGGFQVGLVSITDESSISNVIAQWGEDKNFDGLNDGYCSGSGEHCRNDADCVPPDPGECVSLEDRDPTGDGLTKAWGTSGGCGWQSKADGALTGGIWHTGLIYGTEGTCLVTGDTPGQCQGYETVGGSTGQRLWWELLTTPPIQKVNDDSYTIEIVQWSWNQAVDLSDQHASWSWELDTDITKLEPVDLKSDNIALRIGGGAFGAVVAASNPGLTNGFSVFAPVVGTCWRSGNTCYDNSVCTMTCNDGVTTCDYYDDDKCKGPTNHCDVCFDPQDDLGKLGNNRTARNSCYFQGESGIKGEAMRTLGPPRPLDDDIDNDSDGTIDEYVGKLGPIRNMDMNAMNGPDMRVFTLEDLYGDTGDFFQGGVGMITVEKATTQTPDPETGYGVGVDDMVIQWREFNLIDDAVECTAENGECAVLDVNVSDLFQGNALIKVTVLEKSPPAENDCDWDDVGDGTQDCDSNGINDVVVRAYSLHELTGEILVLNHVGGNEYKADLAVSSSYNAPGVIFVGPLGEDDPNVTFRYMDTNDGSGMPCKLAPDPATWAIIEVDAQIHLSTRSLVLKNAVLSDNGDDDGYADTNETVTMWIELTNNTGVDLSGIRARLATNDPKIDCIINPTIDFGDLPDGQSQVSTGAFVFKVGDIQRTGHCFIAGTPCTNHPDCTEPDDVCDSTFVDFAAPLTVMLSSNEFDASLAPQVWNIQMDLDAVRPPTALATTFVEGFETGTFGGMTTMNMDDGRHSLAGSDGFRCQYVDPDWIYSNSYQVTTDCYMGTSESQAQEFFWNVSDDLNDSTDPGRAFMGRYSLYMGDYMPLKSDWSTPMGNLEAVATDVPMNIGLGTVCESTRTTFCDSDVDCPEGEACVDVNPELSYVYQVSMVDARCANLSTAFKSADGGTVNYQLATADGTPYGVWKKIYPYQNVYDKQKEDNYVNCFFDPTDDGNNEDDFFDPSDPYRRLGPSTGCFPEYSYCDVGSTDGSYSPNDVGLGGEPGSGLQGTDPDEGTWVRSTLNLAAANLQGRRIRIRFANGSIKAGPYRLHDDFFQWEEYQVCDDGWWVDNIQVTDSLTEPAVITADTNANTGLPDCGADCADLAATLVADPDTALPAPGQMVELDASGSSASRCVDGTLQYRFWIDGDGDSDGEEDTADTVVRSWTDNPVLLQAPDATATYVAEVRCTADYACTDQAALEVVVNCPSTGNLVAEFETVTAPSPTVLQWTTATTYNFGQGLLSTLNDTYATTATGTDLGPAASHDISGTPPAGDGWWYLFKAAGASGGFCNEGSTYGSTERDAELP